MKSYINTETNKCLSTLTMEKRGIALTPVWVELVRCRDGVLRPITEVAESDRFEWCDDDDTWGMD